MQYTVDLYYACALFAFMHINWTHFIKKGPENLMFSRSLVLLDVFLYAKNLEMDNYMSFSLVKLLLLANQIKTKHNSGLREREREREREVCKKIAKK